MSMDDRVWERHANPWSAWSRVSVLPLLAVAVWSRLWLGWWALVPVALVLAWTWINPRLFPPPEKFDSWMTRGVLGERIWLGAKTEPIMPGHARMARILSVVSAIGVLPYVWGLWRLELVWTLLGLVILMGGKLWFTDRMVWLYEDTRRASQARDEP